MASENSFAIADRTIRHKEEDRFHTGLFYFLKNLSGYKFIGLQIYLVTKLSRNEFIRLKNVFLIGLVFSIPLDDFLLTHVFIQCEKTADEIAHSTKHWPQILRPAFAPPKKFVQLY